MRKDKRKVDFIVEILAVLLALGVVSLLCAIFYLSSHNCGQAVPIRDSLDCKKELR